MGGKPPSVTNCEASPHHGNPFVDKMKRKLDSSKADMMFNEMPHSINSPKAAATQETMSEPLSKSKSGDDFQAKAKSWSQVVKDDSPVAKKICFSYVPPPDGEIVVNPPDDVLIEGNNKLKTSIVGTFTKGTVPYLKVLNFANSVWKSRGLLHVGQKDNRTFIFRFASELDMNNALAKGTWYIERKPMVVHAWGTNVNAVTTMPLWARFDGIPDSYWNADCLSRLASVIGPPICADELTSQMEVLPFAKICVKYTIGDTLPTSIPVTVLHPCSGEKHTEKVLVSYPNRPLICTACKSLGHLIGSCPTVTRKWVRKTKDAPQDSTINTDAVGGPDPLPAMPTSIARDSPNTNVAQAPPLTPVKGPKDLTSPSSSKCPEDSATPSSAFKNLRNVDEIDMKLPSQDPDSGGFQPSKAQRKRLRRAKGKSPNSSH